MNEPTSAPPPICIWIDADACPRSALRAARAVAAGRGIELITVSTWRHELDTPGHIEVDAAPQATDLAILARMSPGDVVITQDYGLAALVLARQGRALTPSGLLFTGDNIDVLLAARADSARLRQARRSRRQDVSGSRIKSAGPRTAADDRRFAQALAELLSGRAPL
ncbi:MAG: DUF188 domain-containing protein [Firmicutes bacterium]|nr:DUF188 domain-containing protein [Bacillota bacterium]